MPLRAAILAMVLPAALALGQQYVRLEPDTNRPGGDYQDFELKEARPEICQRACANDSRCRAFTYVKPGIQGRLARCYLKKTEPKRVADRCCVSGVKTAR